MPFYRKLLLTALILGLSPAAHALPIGFGHSQEPLEYDEIKTPNFILYHDERTPHEARSVLTSLEAARPALEGWMAVKRDEPLPVVMTAVAGGASFANFITDAVELQTLGRGGRDLAWHEFVHSTMYRHLDNWFGPTGAIIHLPWMPAWWIEGLAEALSQSQGSDEQAGIERYHALTGRWPSYDKLHSLYGKGGFTRQGYAASGAFVSYILRRYGKKDLPGLLHDFYRYSMPWWWPWAVVPFNGFMPMDAALENIAGKSGEELYDEYKLAATAYWKKRGAGPYLRRRQGYATFSGSSALATRGMKVVHGLSEDYDYKEVELTFDGKGAAWATTWRTRLELPDELATFARITNPDFQAFVITEDDDELEPTYEIAVRSAIDAPLHTVVKTKSQISRLFESREKLIWLANSPETTELCYVSKELVLAGQLIAADEVHCPVRLTFPKNLTYLGHGETANGKDHFLATELWFRWTEETLVGDRHRLAVFYPDERKPRLMPVPFGGRPVSMAVAGKDRWLLVADRATRFLRKLDANGHCQEERLIANHPERVLGLADGSLVLSLYNGSDEAIVKLNPSALAKRSCRPTDDHASPLLYAMNHGSDVPLAEAVTNGSFWHVPTTQEIAQRDKAVTAAAALDETDGVLPETAASRPANWRGRPLFGFPWIGADALGYQYGMVSVPLMDQMQNETLRLTMLYGVNSRFPQTELGFQSTRFKTIYQIDLFRYQSFNGVYQNEVLYYDERGGRLTATRYFTSIDTTASYGVKSSTLIPYLGPHQVRRGHHNEFFLNLSTSAELGRVTWSNYLQTLGTGEKVNKNFDYNQVGVGTTLSIPFSIFNWRMSTFGLGLSGSRTRGKKMKFLKEVYRPLKTFVPGSGGGLNEINKTIVGPGFLTSAQYGNTQARAKASWTFPLIPNLEKLVSIFYLERLDFTAFYNYGGAWYGPKPDLSRLISAHGYNLDLQSDIKGVTVNVGLGAGQVVGQDFEAYVLFGFDALIN